MRNLKCKKCGSEDVTIQVVAEGKKRGIFASIMWIFLALCTCGLILLVPALSRKGTKTVTYAVCNNCGRRWKV